MTISKTPASGDSSEAVRGALPYIQPKLTIYGSIKELTGGVSGTVGDGGVPTMMASDPVLKENVVRVGEHPAGFTSTCSISSQNSLNSARAASLA